MSTTAAASVLVLLLVLVPLASALVVPVFGRAARRVAILIALLHLGVTAAVVVLTVPLLNARAENVPDDRDTSPQVFEPLYVPGDSAGGFNSDNAIGRTNWTLMSLSATSAAGGNSGPKIQFFLGVDGLNLWLVALASLMLVPVILVSSDAIREKPGAFYGWLFLLQAGLIGCFLSFDVILFYVFFELTLIPAFFLIGRWGVGSGRRDAARKFFLYTLAGSLLTLLGVIGVVLANPTPLVTGTDSAFSSAVVRTFPKAGEAGPSEYKLAERGPVTFSLPDLMRNVQVWANAEVDARAAVGRAEVVVGNAPAAQAAAAQQQLESAKRVLAEAGQLRAKSVRTQFWLFVLLMAGFMVKVPIWPFHTWLPAAYGEAPTGVVMILSALMAKLGTFGIVRLVLPLVPDAAIQYGLPVVGALASVGIVYAAFCAFASKDMKLLVAYSSVSHLGFVVLGVFALNREGLTGAVLHMVNHGLSTAALFAVLGFFMLRYGTTEMSKFGGMMGRFPAFAVLAFVICLASVGLPGLNNFVSEMMMMAGLFDADNPDVTGLWPAVVAAVGIFLSAWYTLTMLRRVFFNPLKEPEPIATDPAAPAPVRGMNRREFSALGLLAGLCLVLGLYPQPVIETMKGDVRTLANVGDMARARIRGVPYASKEPPVEEKEAAPAVAPALQPKGAAQPKGGRGKKGPAQIAKGGE